MENDGYPGGWFGLSWGAPVCEDSRRRPTPVGASCLYCERPIELDDQGLLIPGAKAGPNDTIFYVVDATHLACFLEQIGAAGVLGAYCEICRSFHPVEQDCDP